jgi:hypothetical protein
MARILIWPDLYREQGHWLPCISLANSLQDTGNYTVEFMGIPDCESIVTDYGGTFHTVLGDIYPIGHTVENDLEPVDQRWKPAHLLPICRGALKELFSEGSPNRPDLLVSGYFNSLEALIIHHMYGIPVVVITTYLRHPQEVPAVHVKTKLVYMSKPLSQKIIELSTGSDTMTINEFISPLVNAVELIPCAREFDFYDDDWVHRENTYYVEPMITRKRLDGSTAPISDPLDGLSLPDYRKLIFATSGSQVDDYLYKAEAFFDNLIEMMSTEGMEEVLEEVEGQSEPTVVNPGYHLVLAVGEKLYAKYRAKYNFDHSTLSTLPDNVSIFSWVSQLDILKLADVVFMHGGLATIKESIWEQVPIVIVPHGKDQIDNALRIREIGVGIVSEVQEMTPTVLRQLLTDATANPWIKKKLLKMRNIFNGYETKNPKPSVEKIQEYLEYLETLP